MARSVSLFLGILISLAGCARSRVSDQALADKSNASPGHPDSRSPAGGDNWFQEGNGNGIKRDGLYDPETGFYQESLKECRANPHNLPKYLLDGECWINADGQCSTEAGSDARDTECVHWIDLAGEIRAAQEQLADAANSTHSPGRVFHLKQNSCAIGFLRLSGSHYDWSKAENHFGMLSSKETYKVLLRYSGGMGKVVGDILPDVRGLGLKIFGVVDTETGKIKQVDFPMTNSPVPFTKNTDDFIAFMKAGLNGPIAQGKFIAEHFLSGGYNTFSTSANVLIHDQIKERYWSGHPYILDANNLVFKLNVEPLNVQTESRALNFGDFEARTIRSALNHGFQYRVNAQFYKDERVTPIGDRNAKGLIQEWKEADAPSIEVATINVPPQTSSPDLDALCDSTNFSPENTFYRAVGNMGRSRPFLYSASSVGRGATPVTDEAIATIAHQVIQH